MAYRSKSDELFSTLRDVPLTQLPLLLTHSYTELLPRSSKALLTNLFKDILSVKEPRLLVLTGHLYFDYILDRMVDKENHSLSSKQRESFYAKLEFLNKCSKFDCHTYSCLYSINRLRNNFAHNIFFDIVDWDATTIPYTSDYQLRIPKRRDLLRAFNIIVVRLTFFVLPESIIKQNKWLYLENVPR